MDPAIVQWARHVEPSRHLDDAIAALHVADDSIAFLQLLDPVGPHHLAAFTPDGPKTFKCFEPGDWDGMRRFIAAALKHGRNLYFSANEPREGAPDDKLSKDDIAAIRCLFIDLDPPGGNSPTDRVPIEAKAAEMAASDMPPTLQIDSGGGQQALWMFGSKLPAAGHREWAEEKGRALRAAFGGDAVQNIDRLLRLPGALNVPDVKKRLRGRIARPTAVTHESARRYVVDDFSRYHAPVVTSSVDPGSVRAEIEATLAAGHEEFEQIDEDLRRRFEATGIARGDLWARGAGPSDETSRSHYLAALARALNRGGDFSPEEFARLAMSWPWANDQTWAAGDWRDLQPRKLAHAWSHCGGRLSDWLASWLDQAGERTRDIPLPLKQPPAEGDVYPMLGIRDILNRPPPQFFVARHFPRNSVGFVYGRPSGGKSFLTLDLSLHVVHGLPDWHGDPITIEPGAHVLYLCREGNDALPNRLRAWLKERGVNESPIDFT